MKKRSYFTLFFKSLYSFQDLAKFRFVDIGKTIVYAFILTTIYFLPSFYIMMFKEKNYSSFLEPYDFGSFFIVIPLMIVFSFILNVGIVFTKISILAFLGQGLAKISKRHLPYRNSWKLTTYCITLPTVLFGILHFLQITIPYDFLIDIFISVIYLIISIQYMPKMKKQVIIQKIS